MYLAEHDPSHLIQQPPISLRHQFYFVENHMQSLKSLMVTSDSHDSLLSTVLLNKLHNDIHLFISRKVSGRKWTLDSLMKELQDDLQARERVVSTKPSANTIVGKGGWLTESTYCGSTGVRNSWRNSKLLLLSARPFIIH